MIHCNCDVNPNTYKQKFLYSTCVGQEGIDRLAGGDKSDSGIDSDVPKHILEVSWTFVIIHKVFFPVYFCTYKNVLLVYKHMSRDARKPGLRSYRNSQGAWNLGFKKKSNCSICKTKLKGLISCAFTAQLICAFFFCIGKNLVSVWRGSHTMIFVSSSLVLALRLWGSNLALRPQRFFS